MKEYPAYKNSGIDWIGEIPAEWKVTKIKFNTYVKGRIGWQGLKSDEFIDEGPYLVTGTDLINGKVNWDTCYHISDERYNEAPQIQLRNNDLLITKDGTIGKLAIVNEMPYKAILNSGLFITRPIDYTYTSEYLFWVLSSDVFWRYFKYYEAGSTIKHLYQETFINFSFPLPDINEQLKISNYLKTKTKLVDRVINDKSNLVDLLKEKRQEIITRAVTKGLDNTVPMKDSGFDLIGEIPENWDITKVKNIVEGIKDGTHGSFNRVPVGKQLLSAKNVFEDGLLLRENESLISEEDFTDITSNGYPRKNDVLLCSVGTIGRSCLYTYDEPFAFQRSVMFLRPNYKILPQYLHYFVISSIFQNELKSKINMAAQGGVYMGTVNNMMVILPSLSIQTKIVEYLNQELTRLDSVLIILTSEIVKLKEYRQSIISEAVTGKVEV